MNNKKIRSKKDLKYFIYSDLEANDWKGSKIKLWWLQLLGKNTGMIIKFLILLRKTEYYYNKKNEKYIYKILFRLFLLRNERIGRKLGFEIPPNTFGEGLKITHIGNRIINWNAKIGKNCLLHSNVNIGTNGGNGPQKVPIIGDNVYIGPGVKIFGDIEIANDIAIGANSVVNKSFLEPGITIAGIPAKKISNKGSYGKVPNK